MSIGSRIRMARKDKGFTQEYVADALGVSRQAVFKWEKDQARPDTKNLIALSDLLGISVEYLTKGKAGKSVSRKYPSEPFFRVSLILLSLIPVCWLVGLFSGAYTDMVQIPLAGGDKLGVPLLMYGHSPAAVALEVVSIVCLVLFVALLVLGHHVNKNEE